MHRETSCCRISKNYSRWETLLFPTLAEEFQSSLQATKIFICFIQYVVRRIWNERKRIISFSHPLSYLSYLPISSHLILFTFLSSLSSFLDFPILRTSLDISTLITYIFLEIKTLEYWVTLALSQSRRKESSSLPQVSVCFYHCFLQKLHVNVNNIKHSKCTNFQFIYFLYTSIFSF